MRTILFMRAVVMGIADVTRNKIAMQAKRMSNETNWQAFCDLSRMRISFTFIFFAIFTECLESNAGNLVMCQRASRWHEDANEATRTASMSGLQ